MRSVRSAVFLQRKSSPIHGRADRPNCIDPPVIFLLREAPLSVPTGGGPYFAISGRVRSYIDASGLKSTVGRLRMPKFGEDDGPPMATQTIWGQLHTTRAAIGGYCLPRVYARRPNESHADYRRMCGEIRGLIGEEAGWGRICAMDYGDTRRSDSSDIPTFHHRMVRPPRGEVPLSQCARGRAICEISGPQRLLRPGKGPPPSRH